MTGRAQRRVRRAACFRVRPRWTTRSSLALGKRARPVREGRSMRKLRLVGLSADGRQVVFVDDAGSRVRLPPPTTGFVRPSAATAPGSASWRSRWTAPCARATSRPGSGPARRRRPWQHSPRSPSSKIMPYCVPVLAEREHVAELGPAQPRPPQERRRPGAPPRRRRRRAAARPRRRPRVGRVGRLAARRRPLVDPASPTCPASSERAALFVFDSMGRYSLADDDEAKWLTGEKQSTSKGPQPRERPARRPPAGGRPRRRACG